MFSLFLNKCATCISLDKGIVKLKHKLKILESYPKKKWLRLKMFSLVVTTQKEDWNLHGKLKFVRYSAHFLFGIRKEPLNSKQI